MESFDDWRAKIPLVLSSISHLEQDTWDSFLLSTFVSDAWHEASIGNSTETLHFSWGFRQQSGRLLERLDRFYVGDWAPCLGGACEILYLAEFLPSCISASNDMCRNFALAECLWLMRKESSLHVPLASTRHLQEFPGVLSHRSVVDNHGRAYKSL